jgi:hypothetical protein
MSEADPVWVAEQVLTHIRGMANWGEAQSEPAYLKNVLSSIRQEAADALVYLAHLKENQK